jgi:uncharacterized protein YdhG (YjbR/CyaY superfamily)
MAKTSFGSVDEYLAAQPPATRAVLAKVRAAIRAALPGAEEGISYQIPVYKLDGKMVLYFAGWKDHVSLYPVSDGLAAKLGAAVAGYETSGKGTIRFPLSARVPVGVVKRIARLRAAEARQPKAKSKPRPKSKAGKQ